MKMGSSRQRSAPPARTSQRPRPGVPEMLCAMLYPGWRWRRCVRSGISYLDEAHGVSA